MRILLYSLAATLPMLLLGCVCAPVSTGNTVRLPCCGSYQNSQTINISTGSAPWRVRVLPSGSLNPVERTSEIERVTTADRAFGRDLPAIWVGPPGPSQGLGDFRYELRIDVPNCEPAAGGRGSERSVRIVGRFASDDSGTVSVVSTPPSSGSPVSQPGDRPGNTVTEFEFNIPPPASGIKTLVVDVPNRTGGTGLLLQAVANSYCTEV